MTNKVLHDNDTYSIVVVNDQYAVVNKETGVREYECKALPEAISFAEHSNAYLVNRMWEWIAASAKQSATIDDDLATLLQ